MTDESPGKVFSLLGAALVSMAFLFAITVTDASLSRVYNPSALPNVFSPEKVVASLDNVSNSFAYFVHNQLVVPGEQSYAIAADNLKWIVDESSEPLVSMLGLGPLVNPDQYQMPAAPKVAGAYTERSSYAALPAAFSIDTLYHILIR